MTEYKPQQLDKVEAVGIAFEIALLVVTINCTADDVHIGFMLALGMTRVFSSIRFGRVLCVLSFFDVFGRSGTGEGDALAVR